jgi:16S rRNA (guanine527-N7)-methyltransferase
MSIRNIQSKEKQFNDLLMEWNAKINLVSRKKADIFDLIDESKMFFEAIDFKPGIQILDLGTGGGLPGIVIAIHHPEASLTLLDSIQKKIKAVDDIINKLGLTNANAICTRAEELSAQREHKNKYDYVVTRSVAVLPELSKWSKDLLKPGGKLITIKGGDLSEEINQARKLKFVKKIEVTEKSERKIINCEFGNAQNSN